MRGKLTAQERDRTHAGITPADAGKTAMFPTADSGE